MARKKTKTSENYTREKTTIFWTLENKTTDGRKDRRNKTQRKAKKDLDK